MELKELLEIIDRIGWPGYVKDVFRRALGKNPSLDRLKGKKFEVHRNPTDKMPILYSDDSVFVMDSAAAFGVYLSTYLLYVDEKESVFLEICEHPFYDSNGRWADKWDKKDFQIKEPSKDSFIRQVRERHLRYLKDERKLPKKLEILL